MLSGLVRTIPPAALALGLAVTALPAAHAEGTSTDPTQVAAHYLQTQLAAGGDHFSVEGDWGTSVDYGVTADAVLALAATGTAQTQAAATTDYLAAHVVDYTGFGDPTEVYAGSVAKLVNVAIAQGRDPRAFGGHDLVATLQGLETADGRFSDDSQWGDYSNVFGQSFALIALKRAGVNPSPASIEFLLEQQCPGGGFQLYMDAPCADDSAADPDATAMAVQALLFAGDGAQAATAASAGLDFLASVQGADGGLGGGAPQTAPNANSTGLAGQAFLAGGRTAQAALARSYITDLQYGCELPAPLHGGIAYDPAAYDAQVALGAAATPIDQDRRSTTQALLALAGTPLYAVTAAGASATAPALACETTPPTGEPTAGPTTGPTAPPVTGPVVETDVPGGTGGLPLAAAALMGVLLLVVAGGGAVLATARRGAHR